MRRLIDDARALLKQWRALDIKIRSLVYAVAVVLALLVVAIATYEFFVGWGIALIWALG